MTAALDLLPWWWPLAAALPIGLVLWIYFGLNGLLAALLAGGVASVYARGRRAGVTAERVKQRQADDQARQTIHEIKEDVRAIPASSEGKAERDRRFDRWSK